MHAAASRIRRFLNERGRDTSFTPWAAGGEATKRQLMIDDGRGCQRTHSDPAPVPSVPGDAAASPTLPRFTPESPFRVVTGRALAAARVPAASNAP